VETLDVNAPLAGDISERLERFSFDDNLKRTLTYVQEWVDSGPSPRELEILERGVTSFPCERPAAPYQEEKTLMVPPLVRWAALALFYRYWPVGVVLLLGVAVLVVWRVRVRRRRKASLVSS
jgi:hypothetical protein